MSTQNRFKSTNKTNYIPSGRTNKVIQEEKTNQYPQKKIYSNNSRSKSFDNRSKFNAKYEISLIIKKCAPYKKDSDWDNLTEEILRKTVELKETEKSLFLNEAVKFSLHEIIKNKEIIKYVNEIHRIGRYPIIHYAIWPCLKKLPEICPELIRSEEDILQTVKILMENTKFTILDKNEKGESVIKSLFQATKEEYISKEICTKIYDYLMKPTEMNIKKMTTVVFNKLTETTFEDFKPIICWLASLPTSTFAEEFYKKFQQVKQLDRDSKTGKYRELSKYSAFLEKIMLEKNLNSSDFNRYFKSNPWNPEHISYIKKQCASHFIEANLTNCLNVEIIGGVVGEFATFEEIIKYCNPEYIEKYPGSIMTCVAHAYPRFKKHILLKILESIYMNAKGKIKFNVEEIIRMHDFKMMENINLKKSIPTSIIVKSVTPIIKKPIIKKKLIIEEKNKITRKPVEHELFEILNLTILNKLEEEPEEINNEIIPENLDDTAYSIKSKYMKNYKLEDVCNAIIVNSMLNIHTEIGCKGLKILINYLFKNGIDKVIFSKCYKSGIDDIVSSECYKSGIISFLGIIMMENVKGSEMVKLVLENIIEE